MGEYTFRLKITKTTYKIFEVINADGTLIGEIVCNKGYIGPKAYKPEYISMIEEALSEFRPFHKEAI